jgi:hypothetical protein
MVIYMASPPAATGGLYPFDCSTIRNSGEYEKDGLSYGSFGNPTVYMQSATSGVGLCPNDDIFLVHGVATQNASARFPRQPAAIPSCDVTSPPSVNIADLNLGLRTGRRWPRATLPFCTAIGCHWLSFLRESQSNLAVIAVILCQIDGTCVALG